MSQNKGHVAFYTRVKEGALIKLLLMLNGSPAKLNEVWKVK